MAIVMCSNGCGIIYKPITLERFWSKVKKTKSCWNWIGAKDSDGYGQFKHKKQFKAHRFAYELIKGKISKGLQIDHLCRNRKCVNPDHLEAVTPLENQLRGISKNRNKTHCKQGHPFDVINTYFRKNGRRQCRMCGRIYARKKYAKIRRTKK